MLFNMRCIFLFLVLLTYTKPHSQLDFSLKAGLGIGLSKSKTFNLMRDSYNSLNEPTITNKLDVGLNKSYTLELNAELGKMFLGFGLTSFNYVANAEFTNKSSRNFHFKHNYYNVLIGFSKPKSSGDLIIASGICVSDYFMTSFVTYPNGDKDYAKGILQGTYHTNGFGIPVMIEYNKDLTDNFKLYTRLQLQVISATKFTLFNVASGQTSAIYDGIEILDDTKHFLLELGLKYNL
jgi:hypothetical protein